MIENKELGLKIAETKEEEFAHNELKGWKLTLENLEKQQKMIPYDIKFTKEVIKLLEAKIKRSK